ncbi:MAG: hypothetical protein ABI843_08490 [Dokdonella sp.]
MGKRPQLGDLELTGLGRKGPPVVVASIEVADRRIGEFHRIDAVARGQADRDVVTADLFELVVAEFAHARKRPECIGLDDSASASRIAADRAIAFACAAIEVDVRFEADAPQ